MQGMGGQDAARSAGGTAVAAGGGASLQGQSLIQVLGWMISASVEIFGTQEG